MLSLARSQVNRLSSARLIRRWPLQSVPSVSLATKKRIDTIVVRDAESFAATLVSIMKDSEIDEKVKVLKTLRTDPLIDPRSMGKLLHAADPQSNWFKQWVQNAMAGSYDRLYPINIPFEKYNVMVEYKSKLAAALYMTRTGTKTGEYAEFLKGLAHHLEEEPEGTRRDLYHEASRLADQLGKAVHLNRMVKLTDMLVRYSEEDRLNTPEFRNELKTVCGLYLDLSLPLLRYMGLEVPADMKLLSYVMKDNRKKLIVELTDDIELISSRHKSRVISHAEQTAAAVMAPAAPSPVPPVPPVVEETEAPRETVTEAPMEAEAGPEDFQLDVRETPANRPRARRFLLKPRGAALRFDFAMRCFSLTGHTAKTRQWGYQTLLEKNRALFDPTMQLAESDIMHKVHRDSTPHSLSSSSSLLDLLDGPSVNLSTKRSLIEREAEFIEQRLRRDEADQRTIAEVESSLASGNIPTIMVRDDADLMARKVIIDNLPNGVRAEDIGFLIGSKCGGVENVQLFTEGHPLPTYIPTNMTMSQQEKEEFKHAMKVKRHKEAVAEYLAAMPQEYYKNGKPKKKRIPEHMRDELRAPKPPSVSHKKVAEKERTGNYAVLTLDSEWSMKTMTRPYIKLFGICIGGNLCRVIPATEYRNVTVQIGEGMDVRRVVNLINQELEGQFECHVDDRQVVDTCKPLFVKLKFDSHAEGWAAFQKLHAAAEEKFLPIRPSFVEGRFHRLMRRKANEQKTYISMPVPLEGEEASAEAEEEKRRAEARVSYRVGRKILNSPKELILGESLLDGNDDDGDDDDGHEDESVALVVEDVPRPMPSLVIPPQAHEYNLADERDDDAEEDLLAGGEEETAPLGEEADARAELERLNATHRQSVQGRL